MKQVLTILMLCLGLSGVLPLNAQNEGNQWVIGYWSNGNPDYSVMFMDFSSGQLIISWELGLKFKLHETDASICDGNGIPLLWTNGMQIMGTGGQMIADTIAYSVSSYYWDYYYFDSQNVPFGFPEHDGAIILPVPGYSREYSVIYHSAGIHPDGYFAVNRYLESRVRLNPDTSFSLLYKDSLIWSRHQWFNGTISACRHANGRDWWLITFEADSPIYYSFTLDPVGLRLDHTGEVDTLVREGLGQAAISPLGNYLARMDATTFDEGQFITLYAFDRCNGDLQRISTLHTEAGYFTGVAFSPSERYLYGDDNTHLWQWDLWADNIAASQTLVDTFDGFVQPGWFVMWFGPMMLAPDGRIYVVPPAGSSEFIHVINRPNLPAADCEFKQHSINLTVPNARSGPNLPNYHLGPLDGSSCDTLGFDNHPVAWWRHEVNDADPLEIRFTDLSYFRPETWHWDFGDGNVSNEQNPIHTYPAPGQYYACLTVSNEYSSDTSCQFIEILGVSTHDIQSEDSYTVFPNPFTDYIEISPADGYHALQIRITNITGQSIAAPQITCPCRLRLGSIPAGVYFYTLEEDGKMVGSGKVVKL